MNKNNISVVVIGDIHGCAKTIESMIKKTEKYYPQKWIFIGDYIDRGPDSQATLDILIELEKKHDVIFLRGNHEQMILDVIDLSYKLKKKDNYLNNLKSHPKSIIWINNGGKETLKSFGTSLEQFHIEPKYIDFFKRTIFFFEVEEYFFVHAGVDPNMTLMEAKKLDDKTEFLWIREHLNSFYPVWEKTIVFGHTPFSNPWIRPKRLGIDTGCVYNEIGLGRLTALFLPTEKYIFHYNIDT